MTGATKHTADQPSRLYTQQEVSELVANASADAQTDSNSQAMAKLITKSNRILVSVTSHAFPIDLFPNTITVEEGRITIIKRHLLSSEVHSIDLKNISNIFINTTIFFSQLVVISKTFEENEIRLRNLRTKEAIFVRRIIEGLRVVASKQIDTSVYSVQELVAKLEELSTTEIVT